jgi:hypothetical protein
MKYIIKSGANSFATKYCPVGKYNNKGHNKANLVIKVEGSGISELYLNAKMLREALITNPEAVKDLLGLQIKDLVAIEIKKQAEMKAAADVFDADVTETKLTIIEEPKLETKEEQKVVVKKTQPKKVEVV